MSINTKQIAQFKLIVFVLHSELPLEITKIKFHKVPLFEVSYVCVPDLTIPRNLKVTVTGVR